MRAMALPFICWLTETGLFPWPSEVVADVVDLGFRGANASFRDRGHQPLAGFHFQGNLISLEEKLRRRGASASFGPPVGGRLVVENRGSVPRYATCGRDRR